MNMRNASLRTFEEDFGLLLGKTDDDAGLSSLRCPGEELLTREGLESLLRRFGQGLGSTAWKTTASLFTKYYAKKLCGVLYAMSVMDKGLLLPLRCAVLELREAPDFRIRTGNAELVPAPASGRAAWRRETVRQLFAEHLAQLLDAIARHTCVNKDILWENALVYIRHGYGEWVQEAASEADRQRIEGDYRFLMEEAGPDLLGGEDAHPFAGYSTALVPGKPPVRKTCCMRCLLPEAAYCKTCPRANG
ncbi:hypothetical protein O9H85_24995 [Paenibacillus filicis]|uniref:Aerobactin siderophore biosynthesis IucA/IucC-like C-terminal domain-containing protein n=1 Tax=Paenibacillus gyeongsangnamensis TaxID=3388067 RepID=A0ABT4QFG2_9BACL|nr:IucA/IucC family C-terminal-domain containing protein [Paenibacillus filicis]MCZ8515606.1 hypothetical protein [Paenibacillus filicis]